MKPIKNLKNSNNQNNKWTPFVLDWHRNTTAEKVDKFLTLKKADFDANNYPIPPKPEKIQRMKRDMLGVRYESQNDFQRVQMTMKRLEDLSYAFWNR